MIERKLVGVVVKGRGVGSKIGVPTANIQLDKEEKSLEFGVFAGVVIVADKTYRAAIFIGPPLTFNLIKPIIEAHLLNFNGNIVGEKVTFVLAKKLRDIKKFDSVIDLQNQITKDIALC